MKKERNCSRCKSPMEPCEIEHAYWHGITLVALVENFPTWMCQLCGYRYFEPAVETTLQFIVKDYIKAGGLFPIPRTPYRQLS